MAKMKAQSGIDGKENHSKKVVFHMSHSKQRSKCNKTLTKTRM